jgi:hypothetical protein
MLRFKPTFHVPGSGFRVPVVQGSWFAFIVLGSWFAVVPAGVSLASSVPQQSTPAPRAMVVFVDAGGQRQPIARVDGERWTATCSAASGAAAAPMQPVRRVASRSAEWNAVEPTVREIFSRREREQRLAVARLTSVAMTLEAVYAIGPAANATYYFEAAKQIEDANPNADPDTDPAGVVILRVTGWLRAAGGRSTSIGSRADVEWRQLDRVDASSRVDLVPVGAIGQRDFLVWIMKRETGAAATFLFYETRAGSVRELLESRC